VKSPRVLQTAAARWLLAGVLPIVVGLGVLLGCTLSGAAGRGAESPRAYGHPGTPRITRAQLAADRAQVAKAAAAAKALAASPGMPTCKPPPLPAATYPPGHSYGVPFLAAITNGQILAGYDEWTANHPIWKVGSTTYHLYPWQAKVFDISGWVTGLLQLPSLSATIPASDVVFCDQGGSACVSANPPAGECIHVDLSSAPLPGGPPPPTITNDPPPGHQCYQAPNFCIPYVIHITPVGNSQLTVASVESDGAIDLQVSTAASTTLSISLPGASETCSDSPSVITLSTIAPATLPQGAPIKPVPGAPDLRGLQVPPAPLTGPLATASSTVGGNDFSVPAFSQTKCPLLATVFNGPLAGWNTKSPADPASENNNYYDKNPLPADAGTPGWVQFSATTTVSNLDLPVGPPSGFSLGGG
jgi:hypothetical protein